MHIVLLYQVKQIQWEAGTDDQLLDSTKQIFFFNLPLFLKYGNLAEAS